MKKILLIAAIVGAVLTGCSDDEKSVTVTSITLNKAETTIFVGQSEQLTVTEVLPSNAAEKGVTWSSGNNDRATVDQTGMVTVPTTTTAGTVAIIATAKDGSGVTATCVVTVAHNAYTYDEQIFNIVWAKYHSIAEGLQFAICPTVPSGTPIDEFVPNFFVFECPIEALGQLIKLHDPYTISDWFPWLALGYNGTTYFGEDNNGDDLSGTDNWIKATQNSGTNNFTLEFAMTLNGKRLEGVYTGTFEPAGGWIY
ncbi:MAG: Ig-like domain-containing protein [Bacteroidales bacterium]|nr:Ig-like domain-containing protein [Bacteroidales bacterium]MCL2133694.1 Ig-like domain-containing protein [Bacteroidales bacterium]